ncbi:ligase-associated DNA damage response DEXH box helicase [Melaminivora sp.]|uniref:ligase-associated DNA damage response DEXH box helicase n=1 Tax=Melaminivora sp. TaxID=1933032 RepID=UPI0028A91CE7|nr:ligase-associated DNA damage response DEXH box helicase [Melaminivora sp.]
MAERHPRPPPPDVTGWFAARGWQPFAFQRQVWRAMAAGRSGLLHAITGAGKTYAVWLGALQALAHDHGSKQPETLDGQRIDATKKKLPPAPPLTVLWITPMRALAADTLKALATPLAELAPAHPVLARWTLGARTGDSSSAERSAQARRLPTALVTTPESLSLLLARADAREQLAQVRLVVADEWHELLATKRGVQLQLALARLGTWCPRLMVWGMSATLGNLPEAMQTLLAPLSHPGASAPRPGLLVRGRIDKQLVVDTLLPGAAGRFPWAGHLGLSMLPAVVAELAAAGTTLIFVNARSQAERWYQALLDARPDWAGSLALHHGSLDRGVREWVEAGLKNGSLRAVVATSSLDLGVDFAPVERVLQIGSPRGVARLLQRAGRSGHAPGRPSRVTVVPTQSLEIIEVAAARAAVRAGCVESRVSPEQPIDVLVQHLVTVALGGGFEPEALYAEVRRTHAYRALSRAHWQWCLDFVSGGGQALAAYPDYRRVVAGADGIWRVPEARLARRHRANIGTIVGDASMVVQVLHGARLGRLEESFLARLSPGDAFVFAGQVLELVRIEQMTAYVRRAPRTRATVPRWGGTRLPLSALLARFLLRELARAAQGRYASAELRAVRPLLQLQQRWSQLPTPDTLLAETLRTRDGWHLFLYPLAGRQVHLGLASLLAWRAAQRQPGTFSIAVNDYGLELVSADARDWAALLPGLLGLDGGAAAQDGVLPELLASLNATEMARRRFREIARVAGLVFQSHPGEQRSARQLQASAQLFFEVFRKYDSGNLLLRQAEDEVLRQELDVPALQEALAHLREQRLSVQALERPGPLAFALMVERFREKLSNEALADRIARMLGALEGAADVRGQPPPVRPQDVVPAEPARRRRALLPPASASGEAGGNAGEAAAADAIAQALGFGMPGDAAPPARAPRQRRPSRPLPRL